MSPAPAPVPARSGQRGNLGRSGPIGGSPVRSSRGGSSTGRVFFRWGSTPRLGGDFGCDLGLGVGFGVGFGCGCGGIRGGGGSVVVPPLPLRARSKRGRAAASPGGGACHPPWRAAALPERRNGRRPSLGDGKRGCWTGSGRLGKDLQDSRGGRKRKRRTQKRWGLLTPFFDRLQKKKKNATPTSSSSLTPKGTVRIHDTRSFKGGLVGC